MPGAVQSNIDASVLNAMRARRQYTERAAEEKLRVLRRLRRRYETGSLPKETSVETSFIEQFFARVLDYATLLSHDIDAYHLYAKPRLSAIGQSGWRFPDFTLGSYGSDGEELYLVSAELKGPEANLDTPQGGNYGGLSPVQQAFLAVKGRPSCQWVIVSNIMELRLYRRVDLPYDTASPPAPIATVDLRNVWDRRDLAQLCAHFDRKALLGLPKGTNRELRSELMAALERRHPATPLDHKPGYMRAILVFTPRVEAEWPMFLIEDRLREAILKSNKGSQFFDASSPVSIELAEGYLVAQGSELPNGLQCKVAMSGDGQLQVSVSQKLDTSGTISAVWLVDVVHFFVHILDSIFDRLTDGTTAGRVSPELREVKNVALAVPPALAETGRPDRGKAAADVLGADFPYTPVLQDGDVLTMDVVSELAIYFRGAGGGVRINRDKLRTYLHPLPTPESKAPTQ